MVPLSTTGTPPMAGLIPGQSYLTTFTYSATPSQQPQRLLITSTDGPMVLLIGNEMSWGHKKTYFGL